MSADLRNTWAALRMIRETVETLGAPGTLPSEEAVLMLSGPEPVHEAEHLVAAIKAIVEQRDARLASLEAALRELQFWVNNPVSSYSMITLDQMFARFRDIIDAALAAYRSDQGRAP